MRVVCLGAGGPAGVNFCRAAKDAGYEVTGLEENSNNLPFADSVCDGVAQDRSRLADWERGSFLHAQPDSQVLWLSDHRDGYNTFLPSKQTIALCQDKFETGLVWRRAGLRESPIVKVDTAYDLADAAEKLGYPHWMRARHGAGAKASTLVNDARVASAWFSYWRWQHGMDDFVAEEYLPGCDYCWTSLWHEGELVTSFARERLEWLYPGLAPSGRTGTPTVARVVHDDTVNETAEEAVHAVEHYTEQPPHGLYAVDLREDAEGVPQPTEINAGRFPTTSPLYGELGVSMVELYLRLGMGEKIRAVPQHDLYPEGATLHRHIDSGHVWTHAEPEHPFVMVPRREWKWKALPEPSAPHVLGGVPIV